MPRTFSVEHAKSNRSKCKKCFEKITKDTLRMGTHVESNDDYPSQNNWFHLKCFKKKIRKGPPTKKDIKGFNSLSSTEKKRVLKYVFGNGNDSDSSESESESESESDSEDEPPKKKGRKRKLNDSDSEDEPPKKKIKLNTKSIDNMNLNDLKSKCKQFGLKQSGKKMDIQNRLRNYINDKKKGKNVQKKKMTGKMKKEEEKKYNEIMEDLEGYTVKELKKMLEKNNVKRTGNKTDIIERIIDCKMYGTYPSCPSCYGGTLKINYDSKFGHNGQGNWYCNGYMDDDHFRHCHYKSSDEHKRQKWID